MSATGDAEGNADAGGSAELDTEGRQLLYDLVSIPSVSGDEEACTERLAGFFEAHDREVWIDSVGNVRAPADDAVLLTSHVDTVPGDLAVELAPAEDAEEPALWGRGSVDAKGSLAAMAVAAVETGVSFAGVVGEETDARGARHLVADRANPDAVVNGEPSGWDAVTLGYRGFLAGTYRVETETVHTSRPAPNAVQLATTWWTRVEGALGADANDDGDGDTGIFETVTVKPVSFDGGPTDDGTAVSATVDFQIRIPPGEDPDAIRAVLESVADRGTVAYDEAAFVPAWIASPRNRVAAAFRAAIRAEGGEPGLLRKTGTADSNLYAAAWDCPVVTYGPGDAALDHAPNEHLPLAEFDRSVAVLEAVADRLAGENPAD